MTRIKSALLSAILVLPLMAGCAHRTAVVYGTWGPTETVYYTQWETETHRDHMDYEHRSRAEQKAYWKWRKHHQQ